MRHVWSFVGMVVATSGALPAAEPKLAVTLRGSLDATVGQKLTLRVTAEPAGSPVAVHDAPRGLELVGDSLVWTPTEAQVGTHTVALKVSAGDDDEKIGEWTVVVRPPSVRVTGIGTMMAVADDGKTAVVLSVDRPPNGGDGTWKLTLADLTTMKVLGASEVGNNGRAVAVDSHHAYLAVAGEVVVLRKKDMTVAKRLPVPGQPAILAAVADRWLFVSTDAGKTQVFAVPDLTPADPAAVGLGIHLSGKGESCTRLVPQRTAGGWLYDGVEYDPAFTKARGVLMPRNVAHFLGVNGIVWVGPGHSRDQYGYGYPNPHGGASLLPPWLGPWR